MSIRFFLTLLLIMLTACASNQPKVLNTPDWYLNIPFNSDTVYDTVYITQYNGFTVPTTNQVSYSNGYGEINNMIAPVQTMKGDTMYLTATFFQWSITDWETIEIPIVLD